MEDYHAFITAWNISCHEGIGGVYQGYTLEIYIRICKLWRYVTDIINQPVVYDALHLFQRVPSIERVIVDFFVSTQDSRSVQHQS